MWYNNNVQSQELTFRGFWKLDLPFCILLVQSWNENSKSPTTQKNESNFMWSNTCFPHPSVQVEKVSSHTQKVMETSKTLFFLLIYFPETIFFKSIMETATPCSCQKQLKCYLFLFSSFFLSASYFQTAMSFLSNHKREQENKQVLTQKAVETNRNLKATFSPFNSKTNRFTVSKNEKQKQNKIKYRER